ncbi:MAG: o-succinylbenzoate synthase [Candidatus Heimdallarchaeota archaeon]|nr:o-succinylbenzoate synthase [Candidatus Heimdallarchaeota archaeon]
MYTLKHDLSKIELFEIEMPYVHPFRTSFGEETHKQAIIVKITDSAGNIGWGETSVTDNPSYCYETTKTAWHIQNDFLIPILERNKRKGISVHQILKEFAPVRGHEFAKAGIESSLLALLAVQYDIPLSKLYGSTKTKIPTGVSIGIQKSVDYLVERVGEFLEKGYKRIKIKIEPGWDIEPIKRLRTEFGNIALMVDANSAYTLDDLSTLKAIDEFELTMIEQPLAYNDLLEHKKLQSQLKTAVCLDEPIHNPRDGILSIENDCGRIINIKPARVGGYLNAIKIAEALGQGKVWCGGMLETGIGRIHNVVLQAREEFIIPGDTSGSDRYFHEDIIEPPVRVDKDGFIEVPTNPGLGISVLEERIVRFSRQVISYNL